MILPATAESMDESYDSSDSDRELQVAFSKGLLQEGLNIVQSVPERPAHVNNVTEIKEALKELHNGLPWVERLDLTVVPATAPRAMNIQLGENPDDLTGDAVHDDFKREMKFYRLAQAAVLEGLPRLKSMGIPTSRPDDYMAEMAKTDIQMKKVREKLLSKTNSLERREKAKKLRELKKFGKKVQTEVLQKRHKEKRQMMDAVKKYRKGQTDKLDFLENDKTSQDKEKKQQQGKKDQFQSNKKRQNKNQKYGFGGQKKRSKYNTAESAKDMSDYSVKKHGSVSARYKKGKQPSTNRPGKQRRQTQKNNRKKK